jgi:carbon monoxide dehydrogenase subunit G
MRLDQKFTIPTGLEEAWQLLLDVEQIAPCFPGATVTSMQGDTVKGAVRVKLGPILLTYNGVLEFVERDDERHRLVMDGQGTDTKGNGSASAQVTAHLSAIDANHTLCTLATDLNVTGRPAQFGRGMMLEVGNNILGKFSTNLAASLAQAHAAPAPVEQAALPAAHLELAAEPARARHSRSAIDSEPLDLLKAARGAALKRLAPVAAGLVVVVALIVWWAR